MWDSIRGASVIKAKSQPGVAKDSPLLVNRTSFLEVWMMVAYNREFQISRCPYKHLYFSLFLQELSNVYQKSLHNQELEYHQ